MDLIDFDDDELIKELEDRGYMVRDDFLTKEDKHSLLILIDSLKPDVGSPMYFIREKIANES